jgi:acetolactate synthase-1/2/3 large subunit
MAVSNSTAQALADAMVRHGVTEIFGQSLPSAFFLAAEQSGIRQVTYRTENAGGAMADGYARVSRRVGVVGAQNGPAATLLVPPLAEALKASIPVVALVQEVPRANRDRNAFQELDHFDLFRGVSKWIRLLDDPQRVDYYVDAAFLAATSGRAGPAVLLLPKDVLVMDAPSVSTRAHKLGNYPADRFGPDLALVSTAARQLASAERPLAIAGGGVHLSNASAAVSELQNTGMLPVATTNMGKGSVDETHPLSLGVIGSFMSPPSPTAGLREFVRNADVVLLIGTRTNENGTDSWRMFGDDTKFIHIDIDPMETNRNYESLRLVGDARLTLTQLSAELGRCELEKRRSSAPRVTVEIAEARARMRISLARVVTNETGPIRPERVMHELDALLSPETIVVADASYSTIWMAAYLTARRAGQRFISPRGLAGLGWGLPLALGAKIAQPDAQVVCIVGDGGFAHVWAELETAVRERIFVTIIVLSNGILGFQKHAEMVAFGEHTNAIGIAPIDHAAIARAVGADGIRVDTHADLSLALTTALFAERVTLIDVVIDGDAYPPITAWEDRRDVLLLDLT